MYVCRCFAVLYVSLVLCDDMMGWGVRCCILGFVILTCSPTDLSKYHDLYASCIVGTENDSYVDHGVIGGTCTLLLFDLRSLSSQQFHHSLKGAR